MNNLYNTFQLNDKIVLFPHQLKNNLDMLLEDILKKQLGNKCTKEGYIKKNSVEIIRRSIGKMNSSFLDGSITYYITYKADICNPKRGEIINVEIVDINKMGVLAKLSGTPLNIVIPKQLHKNREEFKKIIDVENKNYKADIEIVGTRYDLNDSTIFVIARLLEVFD